MNEHQPFCNCPIALTQVLEIWMTWAFMNGFSNEVFRGN